MMLELKNYSERFGKASGANFPSVLQLKLFHQDSKEDSFRITFGDVSAFDYTKERREAYFQMPANLEGFERIYKVINGQLIEQ